MPTIECDLGSDADAGKVTCLVKLYINDVEYVPARTSFQHSVNEPFSITLNGFAKVMLNKNDVVYIEVSFDNHEFLYAVSNAVLSVVKLRQWI